MRSDTPLGEEREERDPQPNPRERHRDRRSACVVDDSTRPTLRMVEVDAPGSEDGRPEINFWEYSHEWLESRHDLAERTAELYGWLLRRHIWPTFGASAVGGITPMAVRTWNSQLARLHPTTAAKAYRLLSTIMGIAMLDEIVEHNPCRDRRAGVEHAPERPMASMTEVNAMALAMPPHLRVAVQLAAWCQLRRAEVRGLRRRDIDLDRQQLHVRVTLVTAMSGRSILKPPKTSAGLRTLTIPGHIVKDVDSHLEQHVEPLPDAPIIHASNRALSLAWDAARAEAGRPELRFHDLRHSGLTWAATAGATLPELMRRAGHASFHSAMRYQHAPDGRDRELASSLAALASRVAGEGARP